MMKKLIVLLTLLSLSGLCMSQEGFTIAVRNRSGIGIERHPVVLSWEYGNRAIKIEHGGVEVPYQLDDLNGDGVADELCFLTDLKGNEQRDFSVRFVAADSVCHYASEVYAEMLLKNPKIKEENKQDLYISSLTVKKGTNPYWQLHHHGPAFENRLVGYRIYFDHRQTVDIYGKYHKGLELKETQFYPDSVQKSRGYGDDVLWVGSTLGLGTLRGWNGNEPIMLDDVMERTLSIVASGPLRTIVEVEDRGWNAPRSESVSDSSRITMTTRYTLYAGRRDCMVDISFDREVGDYEFCTGMINVKNSMEWSDHSGLRGCWGTDWPVSAKDSVGHKRETVGLGICIPSEHVISEKPKDKRNYAFVVGTKGSELHYGITFCSANESFGFHSAEEWFAYLRSWKEMLGAYVETTVRN